MDKKNNISEEAISEFAGKGIVSSINDLKTSSEGSDPEHKKLLGEWSSTAICGNDITSSCLYVSALAITQAGILAPIVLAIVGITLYFFRKIYSEVGSALPLNGGTYTLLLNTTSKKIAAAAAGLTILSYVATAVISSSEAIHYLKVIVPSLDPTTGVLALLGFFAFLAVLGIGESAKVAICIFVFHILTLVVLVGSGLLFVIMNPSILIDNFRLDFENINWMKSLILGFSISLLGISGFESSANFIEEQKSGVFPKTLRNMWIAVMIFNPLIALLGISMVPLRDVSGLGEGFLSHLGSLSIGNGFSQWIAVNAFLVLSGAVLTSFVGIQGLVRRMSMDRCMPDILLIQNKWRGTNHWIILGFLATCISIYFVTSGKTTDLAGVYTLSFLFVMSFFAIGNAILKLRRARLPRETKAPWSYIFGSLTLLGVGVLGNIYLNPKGSLIFLTYFVVTLALIMFLLLRTSLLRILLLAVHYSVSLLPPIKLKLVENLFDLIKKVTSVPVLYFSKNDNLATLNEAVQYVLKNEQTKNLTVCYLSEEKDKYADQLSNYVQIIDEIYPKLKIDLILVNGIFSPNTVGALSNRLNIQKNRMFIGSPGGAFPHRIEKLGGVRVILSGDGT